MLKFSNILVIACSILLLVSPLVTFAAPVIGDDLINEIVAKRGAVFVLRFNAQDDQDTSAEPVEIVEILENGVIPFETKFDPLSIAYDKRRSEIVDVETKTSGRYVMAELRKAKDAADKAIRESDSILADSEAFYSDVGYAVVIDGVIVEVASVFEQEDGFSTFDMLSEVKAFLTAQGFPCKTIQDSEELSINFNNLPPDEGNEGWEVNR